MMHVKHNHHRLVSSRVRCAPPQKPCPDCPLDCQIQQDVLDVKKRVTLINIYINSIIDDIERIKAIMTPPPDGMT